MGGVFSKPKVVKPPPPLPPPEPPPIAEVEAVAGEEARRRRPRSRARTVLTGELVPETGKKKVLG